MWSLTLFLLLSLEAERGSATPSSVSTPAPDRHRASSSVQLSRVASRSSTSTPDWVLDCEICHKHGINMVSWHALMLLYNVGLTTRYRTMGYQWYPAVPATDGSILRATTMPTRPQVARAGTGNWASFTASAVVISYRADRWLIAAHDPTSRLSTNINTIRHFLIPRNPQSPLGIQTCNTLRTVSLHRTFGTLTTPMQAAVAARETYTLAVNMPRRLSRRMRKCLSIPLKRPMVTRRILQTSAAYTPRRRRCGTQL